MKESPHLNMLLAFLLVANQDTNDIVIFKRDLKTGLLTPTGKKMR